MSDDVALDEKAIEETMADLSGRFARNIGAVADVLARWREPEVARAVLDAMLDRDGRAFRELVGLEPVPPGPGPGGDPDEPPPPEIPEFPSFCTIVFEVAASLVANDQAWVCRLRTNLSPAETRRFIVIATRCGYAPDTLWEVGGKGPIVPEGPCLQAMLAAGLVTCAWEPVDHGIKLQFGPPAEVCAGP